MKKQKRHNAKNTLLDLLPSIFLVSLIIVIATDLYDCPFNAIFNIPCPGCGMTEAIFDLLRFDIKGAIEANFLFILPILWALYYFLIKRKYAFSKRIENVLLLISMLLFFIRWLSIFLYKEIL